MAIRPPFETVLIANRGEIAVRIARTCRAMGVKTVAVYSEADAASPHVEACDIAVCIGPPPAQASYLNIEAVIDAARETTAEAIHPGYGFLSENEEFARACAAAGVVFIGPPAAAIAAMGDKIAAKRKAEEAGVPTVPGYLGDDQSPKALRAHAERIGTPLLIKAASGGGGKGMRIVRDLDEFRAALDGARREAEAAFGDATVFLERYLTEPRHVEVQVLADNAGRCIHLGERECSIQRRHQKVLEETPSSAVSSALRDAMGSAAVRVAQSVGYVNAGTVEFMLDRQGQFYFLEANTRLQVEHAITEAVTGVDLVREQLLVAAGRPLRWKQSDIVRRGHAIEVRVYAENPDNGFLPSVGRITTFAVPEGPGVRNDAGVARGCEVTPYYDPMLAKLIVHDDSRELCIARLAAALEEYRIGGVETNLAFLRWIVGHPAFLRGDTTTAFIEQHFSPEALHREEDTELAKLAAAAAAQSLNHEGCVGFKERRASARREPQSGEFERRASARRLADVWHRLGGWRHSAAERTVYFADGTCASVAQTAGGAWRVVAAKECIVETNEDGGVLRIAGRSHPFLAWPAKGGIAVNFNGAVLNVPLMPPPSVALSAKSHHGAHGTADSVEAPMSGKIVKVLVSVGDRVEPRQTVVVMEAMKMEHSIAAPYGGSVAAVNAREAATVSAGDVLVEIEAQS